MQNLERAGRGQRDGRCRRPPMPRGSSLSDGLILAATSVSRGGPARSPSADAASPSPSHAYQPSGSRDAPARNAPRRRVLPGLERERASRTGRGRRSAGRDRPPCAGRSARLGRIGPSDIGGLGNLPHGQIREPEHDHRRHQRDSASAAGKARRGDPRGRRSAASGSSGTASAARARAASAHAIARNPSAGPLRARESPRTSRPTRRSPRRSTAAALRRRRAPRARRAARPQRGGDRGHEEDREQDESDHPGVGQQADLEAVGPGRLLVRSGGGDVVVGEVVLAETTDRMGTNASRATRQKS